MTRPVDLVLARLQRVRHKGNGKWDACCPAHDDRNPSLSIAEGDNGAVLLKCFAGCETAAVVAALGLELADLFPPKDSHSRGTSVVQRNFTRPGGERPERQPLREEEEIGPAAALEIVRLDDVMSAPDEAWPHVVDFYFPRREVILLGGHGGVGKSMLALIFAAHVAAGRGWGPLSVEQGRVVFLSFEDEAKVLRLRLRRIIQEYGLPAADVVERLTIFDGTDGDTELALETQSGSDLEFTPMMGLVADAVRGASLVIVDNASDTYGANENARLLVRKFIRRLRREAKANDAAFVLLAHIDKAAAKGGGKGNNFSGSTAWHNSARSRLALVEAEGSGIELLHEKANYGPMREPLMLQRAHGGVLVPVAAEVVQAAQANAQAVLAQSDAQDVLAMLRLATESVPDGIPTSTTGPRTTWQVLAMLPEVPAWMKAKANKRRVEAALLALERAGAIVRETRRTESRHTVQRWAIGDRQIAEAA